MSDKFRMIRLGMPPELAEEVGKQIDGSGGGAGQALTVAQGALAVANAADAAAGAAAIEASNAITAAGTAQAGADAARAAPFVPFSSYAVAQSGAASAPAPLLAVSATVGGRELRWVRQSGGTCLGGGWAPADMVTPLHWGAVGDGVIDDAPAIQAMFTWCSLKPSLQRPAILFPRGYVFRIASTCRYDWRGGTGAIVKMESPIKPDPGIGNGFEIINGIGGYIDFMVREGGATSDFRLADAPSGQPAYDQALVIRGVRNPTVRINGFAYKGRVARITEGLASEFRTSRMNIEYLQTGDIFGASGSAFQCGQSIYVDTGTTFFGSIEKMHTNWDLYGPVFEDTIDINFGYIEGGWRDFSGMEFRGCASIWFDRIELGDETGTVDLLTFKDSETRRCWNISGNTMFLIAGRNNLVLENVGIEAGTNLRRPGMTVGTITTHLAAEAGMKTTNVANISCTHDSHLDGVHLDTTGAFTNCKIEMKYRRSVREGINMRAGGGAQTTFSGVVEDSNTSGTADTPSVILDTLENINAHDLHVRGGTASTMYWLPAGNAFRMYGGSVTPSGAATKFGGSPPRLAANVRGYANEARGAATIPAGSQNVIVPHGMDVAPDPNRIFLQTRNSDPNGKETRPTTVGASSFVIQTVSGSAVVADSQVNWSAKAGNAP